MSRQVVVGVSNDTVILLARFLCGIDVNHNVGEITDLMQEFVTHLFGDRVTFITSS